MRILIPMYYLLVDLKLHHVEEVTGRQLRPASLTHREERPSHHTQRTVDKHKFLLEGGKVSGYS